jgi:hypothetical protein
MHGYQGYQEGSGHDHWPPAAAVGAMTPAEREAHWSLRLLFALEAASENEARTILDQALAGVVVRYVPPGMQPGLPLRDEPVIVPRSQHRTEGIWIARLYPDLTHLLVIDPDDANTRCSFVMNCFPVDARWMAPQNGEHTARREWPPDIWNRQPGEDDVLLHPAVRAVMIYCERKQA